MLKRSISLVLLLSMLSVRVFAIDYLGLATSVNYWDTFVPHSKSEVKIKGGMAGLAFLLGSYTLISAKWKGNGLGFSGKVKSGSSFGSASLTGLGIVYALYWGVLPASDDDILQKITKTPEYESITKNIGKRAVDRFLREAFAGKSLDRLVDALIENPEENKQAKEFLKQERQIQYDILSQHITERKQLDNAVDDWVAKYGFLKVMSKFVKPGESDRIKAAIAAEQAQEIKEIEARKNEGLIEHAKRRIGLGSSPATH